MAEIAAGPVSGPTRIAAVDLFRGLGIALMIAYHLSWDLSHFGFIRVALFSDPFWLGFRTLVVSMFLGAAGFSHALARRRRLDPPSYARRTLVIAGAAALVSGGTWLAFPEGVVRFGILHNLAVASILILPFAAMPAARVGAVGVLVILAPGLVAADLFNAPWLLWVGLATQTPFSVDYVPIFPWFGVTLLGFALGRWMTGHPPALAALARFRTAAAVDGVLAWTGRHTLVIYLVHQPVLFGGVWLAARLAEA